MIVVAIYLLKVSLCSGILFFYYHLALRNKVFHQWNRFYLLTAVALSLVLPVVQFNFLFDTPNQSNAAALLRSFQRADNTLEEFIVVSGSDTTPEQWLLMGYGLVSAIVFTLFILSIFRITSIIRAHKVQTINRVKFINTDLPDSPFSFFQYVFWNRNIPLQSATGQQIFQHEMVHVEERHSFDKVFLQMVLVFCWCNPFFWLIRKELNTIHEFIADQKSVDQNDTSAFAAMILQATYPKHYPSLINPFFQSSIKRRIVMLTKKQKPGLAYIGRILALPLIATTAFAFTVRTETALNIDPVVSENDSLFPTLLQQGYNSPVSDTVPQKKKISAVDVNKNGEKKVSEITITYTDGTKEKMTGEEAQRKGLINDSVYRKTKKIMVKETQGKSLNVTDTGRGKIQPLFIVDGEEISKEELDKIEPNSIESINVWKNESAVEKFGEKGKNGVVEITLRKGPVVKKLIIKENDNVTGTITADKIQVNSSGMIKASGTVKGVIEHDSSDSKNKGSQERKSAQQ